MLEMVLNDRGATGELGALFDRLRNPNGALKVVGRRGANELKKHFRSRNRTPNKLGGRRSGFWRQIADSVSNPTIESSSRIRIAVTDSRFAQKVFGGRITPKTKQALTIPVHADAHDRTVAVFQQETGIQLFRPRKKGGALSNLLAGMVNDDKFEVFYILAKSANPPKDPEALPNRSEFNAAILDEATKFYRRELLTAARG